MGVIFLLSSIPWRLVVWVIAGLCALYFLGWEAFGPPKHARNLLMNGVSGLAVAAAWNGVTALFHAGQLGVTIGPVLLGMSVVLGAPGAALVGVLQKIL